MHEGDTVIVCSDSWKEHQMISLQLDRGVKLRSSYRSIYVIGENYIYMSHFSCFVALAESAVLLGDTLWAFDSSLWWPVRVLLRVSTLVTLLHGGVSFLLMPERQANKVRTGGKGPTIRGL